VGRYVQAKRQRSWREKGRRVNGRGGKNIYLRTEASLGTGGGRGGDQLGDGDLIGSGGVEE
jgi:hypothetical protein